MCRSEGDSNYAILRKIWTQTKWLFSTKGRKWSRSSYLSNLIISFVSGKHVVKKKKKSQEKKADKKAAKTLSAILLTFIITWTPYNVLVLIKPLTACASCIPKQLWDFFYYLCYINSTINPMCYALCNASFRRTYLRILQCKWHTRNRTAMNRGYYGWL